jgi:recombination protein RecA
MATMAELMKDINKEFKENIVHQGLAHYDYERIPFTSPRLNWMTFGGLPIGKLIEFFGENHGGKSTTALDIVANFQNMERQKAEHTEGYIPKKVLYADIENTLDTVWAHKLGVELDDMYILNPTNQGAETVFEKLLLMIDTGEIGLVVIDSLGAMVSNQALEKSVEDKTYGGIAMALTNFSKKAEMLCHKYKCTLIGINQLRADMNSQFGGMTTPGGEAWKFLVSVRLEFRMGQYIDEKGNGLTRGAENPAGNIVNVYMKKNKTCPPTRRTGFYTLKYLTGIDYLYDLVEVAIKYDIVERAGSWFSIINPETGELIEKLQGQSKVNEYLSNPDNIEVLKMIENYIDSKIMED